MAKFPMGKPKISQQASFSSGDRFKLIGLIGLTVVLIVILIYTIVSSGGITEPAKTEHPLRDDEAFKHSFPRKEAPAPAEFAERDEALDGIVDIDSGMTFGEARESVEKEFARDEAALIHLLHKCRVTAPEEMSASVAGSGTVDTAIFGEEGVIGDTDRYRGLPIPIEARFHDLNDEGLPIGNPSGLGEYYIVTLRDRSDRQIFVALTEYPLHLYDGEIVRCTGFFLKQYFRFGRIAPLFVARKLERLPVPEFTEVPWITATVFDVDISRAKASTTAGRGGNRILNDSERAVSGLNQKALFHLLHKARVADAGKIRATADRSVKYYHMLEQSELVRGKAVSIKAVMLRTTRIRLVDNESGLVNVWECYAADIDTEKVFRFFSIDPPMFEKGKGIRIDGYFLQRVLMPELTPVVMPVIVAKTVSEEDMRSEAPGWGFSFTVFVILLGIMAVIGVATIFEIRAGRRFEKDFREKRQSRRGELDISEVAEKLIRERESALAKAEVTNVPLKDRPMPGEKAEKKEREDTDSPPREIEESE